MSRRTYTERRRLHSSDYKRRYCRFNKKREVTLDGKIQQYDL